VVSLQPLPWVQVSLKTNSNKLARYPPGEVNIVTGHNIVYFSYPTAYSSLYTSLLVMLPICMPLYL
jgi:hypothetical protein